MSDSVRPHRQQPTRLSHPWDSPGENSGVGCHFHPQCMKVKSESEVAQSCPTLSDTMDCSPPDSSIQGIFQARVLEWVVIAFSVTTARTWKQPRYPSAYKWIGKLCYIHTMEYYLAIKKRHLSSNEVDETGGCYTEWSKPERKTPIQYINAYIWNLERW